MIVDFDENVVLKILNDGKSMKCLTGFKEIKAFTDEMKKMFHKRKQTIKLYRHFANTTEVEIDLVVVLTSNFNKYFAVQIINGQGKSIFEFENSKIIKLTDISNSV